MTEAQEVSPLQYAVLVALQNDESCHAYGIFRRVVEMNEHGLPFRGISMSNIYKGLDSLQRRGLVNSVETGIPVSPTGLPPRRYLYSITQTGAQSIERTREVMRALLAFGEAPNEPR